MLKRLLPALAVCFVLQSWIPATVQAAQASIEFHYEDLQRFDQALNEIAAGADVDAAIAAYVADASPAFHAFAERYSVTAESIASAYRKYPNYYNTLPAAVPWLRAQEQEMTQALERLKSLAPAGELAPAYFFVADQKAGGTPVQIETESGPGVAVAIGVDVIGITPETDMSEFPKGTGGRAERTSLPQVVVHENAHVMQFSSQGGLENYRSIYSPEGGSMLAVAVREGCAEYVTFLASGWRLGDRHIFGADHEKELWDAFKPVIDEPPFSVPGWFGGTHSEHPDWPSQIGYWLGMQICRHHHLHTEDKEAALRDLFSLYSPDDVRPLAEAYDRALSTQ